MPFRMRFEGEEAREQRFTGTIVGIEDADPKNWPNSKWRCLKVKWDKPSNKALPDRVSPWDIEPYLAPPALNPLSMPKPKRHRPIVFPSSSDSSILTRDGASSKVSIDPLPQCGYPRVLQGQEFSGYGTNTDLSSHLSLQNQLGHVANPTKNQGKLNMMGSPWSMMMPSSLSLNPMNSNVKGVHGGDSTNQVQGNLRRSAFSEYHALHHGHKFEHPRRNLMMLPPPNTSEVVRAKDGNCKLFGFSLLSSPASSGTSMSDRNVANEPLGALHLPSQLHTTFENDQNSEDLRGSKPEDVVVVADDHEKLLQTSQSYLKNVLPKPHSTYARSYTKVHKKGVALGRSVDLTKFNSYGELVAELDQLFELGGELTSPKKDWLVVYTDNEGDMMLVGDDPWQ
ncbi:unnamed protein product [Lupinus luteus]|uniref:Auxin-induced protein n=1 Tax=Lupinus luteus TaxID=3873 RepID=A0AAV1WBK0_LUPLU